MRMTVIPIAVGALGMIPKGVEKSLKEMENGGRIKTIQTTVLLRSARILRRVWRHEEVCCHQDSSERPPKGIF